MHGLFKSEMRYMTKQNKLMKKEINDLIDKSKKNNRKISRIHKIIRDVGQKHE